MLAGGSALVYLPALLLERGLYVRWGAYGKTLSPVVTFCGMRAHSTKQPINAIP